MADSPCSHIVQEKKLQFARQFKHMQRKFDLLQGLSKMDKLSMELEVFDLWDAHGHGTLSWGEVLGALSRCGGLLERLTEDDVATQRGTAQQMDRTAFGHFLEFAADRAGCDISDVVTLVVLAWEPPAEPLPLPDEAALEAAAATAAADGRMRNLFALFDIDAKGIVAFREVAIGLHKIVPNVSLDAAARAAVDVLLRFDRDHDRRLAYPEFVHFMSAFCMASGLTFAQVADALVLAAARPDPSPEETAAIEDSLNQLGLAHYSDARMQQLFSLLDRDGDGFVTFKDLVLGLHKFEPARPLRATASHAAALVERLHGGGGGEQQLQEGEAVMLNRAQFAAVVSMFVEECQADFDQVADYLVAMSAAAPDDVQVAALPGWFYSRLVEARGNSMKEA